MDAPTPLDGPGASDPARTSRRGSTATLLFGYQVSLLKWQILSLLETHFVVSLDQWDVCPDVPRVSVVLPTLCRDMDDLVSAIESVAAQTADANLELVVVDDSPEREAKRLENRSWGQLELRVIDGDGNGLSAALNRGIDAASGEYLALIDDDDRWDPAKLARQLEVFDRGPSDVGLVRCAVNHVDSDGNVVSVWHPNPHDDVESILRGAMVGHAPTLLADFSIIREHDVYFDEDLPCYMDRDWSIRLLEHCTLGTVDDLLLNKQLEGDHHVSDDYDRIRDQAHPRFIEKHRDRAAAYGEDCLSDFLTYMQLCLAGSALQAEQYTDARRASLHAVRQSPSDVGAYMHLAASAGGRFTATAATTLRRTAVRTHERLA